MTATASHTETPENRAKARKYLRIAFLEGVVLFPFLLALLYWTDAVPFEDRFIYWGLFAFGSLFSLGAYLYFRWKEPHFAELERQKAEAAQPEGSAE